jgi:glycine/D-amino acid oxidase-like deaminating enzyme
MLKLFPFLMVLISLSANVVKLDPPLISKETVIETNVGMRPCREGSFNISISEDDEGKIIVNNYGHGGSGWTTVFGSVNKAIKLYEDAGFPKDKPLIVLGSGCIGLVTAIELKRQGYNVVALQTKELNDITSYKAGAIFAVIPHGYSEEVRADISKMAYESFAVYQLILKGEHSYIPSTSVKFMPAYLSDRPKNAIELKTLGLLDSIEPVTLDFGKVKREGFYKVPGLYIEPAQVMKALTQEVIKLEIPILIQEACCFCCVEAPVVFNCTGMGAKELMDDKQLTPIRGHTLTLSKEAGSGHMDYMIFGKFNEGSLYLLPRSLSVTEEYPDGREVAGLIGGTFIPNCDQLNKEELKALDEREFNSLYDRAHSFFYGE